MKRIAPKRTISHEFDEHGEDVEFFEKFHFPIFMEILEIFADGQKCYGALHLYSEHHPFYGGMTPMEIAKDLYEQMKIYEGREKGIALELEGAYEKWKQ